MLEKIKQFFFLNNLYVFTGDFCRLNPLFLVLSLYTKHRAVKQDWFFFLYFTTYRGDEVYTLYVYAVYTHSVYERKIDFSITRSRLSRLSHKLFDELHRKHLKAHCVYLHHWFLYTDRVQRDVCIVFFVLIPNILSYINRRTRTVHTLNTDWKLSSRVCV